MGETAQAIVFTEPKRLESRTYPIPERLEAGELLVETEAATVCGSDVHTWEGRRPYPTPSILGHEIVGTIVDRAPDVTTDTAGQPLSVGDRITWTIMANCGTCYACRIQGLPQKCASLFKYGHARSDEPPHLTGGYAEQVHVQSGTCVFTVPEQLPAGSAAPLMCGAATVAGGLATVGVERGDTVVIQGAGYLGLFAIPVARRHGASQVVVVDVDPDRCELAAAFGADHVLDAGSMDEAALVETVTDLTDGRGADLVVEVTGHPAVIPVGVEMLATGGRYLFHGTVMPDAEFTLDGYDVVTKHLTIQGVHNYDAPHLQTAIDTIAETWDRYPFDALTGPTFPLSVDGVTAAFEAQARREAIRPIVCPE